MPRIATAMKLGLVVGGGTDAHRVSSYNPFVSLQWYLDGTTIGGTKTRGDEEAPSRRQALEMYTRNTAFMANDDDKRGTLEAGKFADLAVLSADYMTAPVKEIGKIKSVLTMVGGKVVYAAPPFAGALSPSAWWQSRRVGKAKRAHHSSTTVQEMVGTSLDAPLPTLRNPLNSPRTGSAASSGR